MRVECPSARSRDEAPASLFLFAQTMTRIVACVLVALAALVKRHSPALGELLHGSTRSSDHSTANVEAFDEMEVADKILRTELSVLSGVTDGSRLAAAGAHELETSAIEVHHCGAVAGRACSRARERVLCGFAVLRFRH